MIQTQENNKKPHFGSELGLMGQNWGPAFFYLSSSVTRYHGQLWPSTISLKTSDSILRKFSDEQTDGQTDESDFIGRSPTNVEHPIDLEILSQFYF